MMMSCTSPSEREKDLDSCHEIPDIDDCLLTFNGERVEEVVTEWFLKE